MASHYGIVRCALWICRVSQFLRRDRDHTQRYAIQGTVVKLACTVFMEIWLTQIPNCQTITYKTAKIRISLLSHNPNKIYKEDLFPLTWSAHHNGLSCRANHWMQIKRHWTKELHLENQNNPACHIHEVVDSSIIAHLASHVGVSMEQSKSSQLLSRHILTLVSLSIYQYYRNRNPKHSIGFRQPDSVFNNNVRSVTLGLTVHN